MKHIFFFLLFILAFNSFAQQPGSLRRIDNSNSNSSNQNVDPTQGVIETKERPPIDQYKIITSRNDTITADTSLTIYKEYKYNYLRKDDFELLPFHNVGHTYNSLGYDFSDVFLRPQFGAQAKRFMYIQDDDVYTYYTPTPYTDLFFKTTFEQGQNIDAQFASNFTDRFNFYIGYRGLRSLGKYQNSLASNGHFRIGVTYSTPNDRYYLRTHFTSQDILNEENGGLTETARQQFVDGDAEFNNRASLDVQFQDAENFFLGRRYLLDHHFKLIKGNDSTQNGQLRLTHKLRFEDKEFTYEQRRASDVFGKPLETQNLNTQVEFQDVTNTVGLKYRINPLGTFGFNISHSDYKYGYNSVFQNEDGSLVPNRILGDIYAVGGSYKGKVGKFQLEGDIQYNISGDFDGNYLKSRASYQISDDMDAVASLNINSRAPNYNFLLNQSDYVNYNWFNSGFENVNTQFLHAEVNSQKYGRLEGSITQIQNYTYFAFQDNTDESIPTDSLVRPFQDDGEVRYIKLKYQKTFNYGKFSLANTIMYQMVTDGDDVFRVPELVTRQSLFYTDRWFKKALFLQTGINFKFFTGYNANAYDPVLAEFVVQDFEEFDNFYTLDFFFNIKVRQARIYFKYENLTTLFETNSSFSAPYYPYRDAVIRFGLVWNFFL